MQKAIELASRGLTLRGMLHMPDGASGKVPAVLIFHSFTGNKTEAHFIFIKLSRMLEKMGIASIRFDFGCSGESDGDFIDMTLSGEIEDACNILDYARKIENIDTTRIGAIGLSMGGAVASALAGKRSDHIKTLCLWAPAGNIGELMMAGDSGKNMDFIRKTGYTDMNGFRVGIGFLDDVVKLNIFEIAGHFGRKVLLLHGDKDPAVPFTTSERYLEYYGGRAELKVIKDADHTFNNVMWEKEVLETTAKYFEKEL